MNAINSGVFEWHITDNKLLHSIINAKIGDKFESEHFQIANLEWKIEIYPNGQNKNEKDYFQFFLVLHPWPLPLSKIITCLSKYCQQTMSSATRIGIFTENNNRRGWADRVLLLSELKEIYNENNLDSLSLIISINILKIYINPNINNRNIWNILNEKYFNRFNKKIDCIHNEMVEYPKQHEIIWNIDDYTMNKFKGSSMGKRFESDIINNQWLLCCYPNGSRGNEGYVNTYIRLCCLPQNIKEIKIKYKITCLQTNDESCFIKTFSYNETGHGFAKFMDPIQIKKYSSLLIKASIDIIKQIEDDKKEENNDYHLNGISNEYQILNVLKEINKNGLSSKEQKTDGMMDHDLISLSDELIAKNNIITQLQTNLNLIKQQNDKQQQIISKCQFQIKTLKENEKKLMQNVKDIKSYLFEEKTKNDENGGYKNKNVINMSSELLSLKHQINTLQQEIMLNKENKDNNNYNNNNNNKQISKQQQLLREWLRDIVNLEIYFDILVENGFDNLESVKILTMNELNIIGIKKLGHKMTLIKHIEQLNSK